MTLGIKAGKLKLLFFLMKEMMKKMNGVLPFDEELFILYILAVISEPGRNKLCD